MIEIKKADLLTVQTPVLVGGKSFALPQSLSEFLTSCSAIWQGETPIWSHAVAPICFRDEHKKNLMLCQIIWVRSSVLSVLTGSSLLGFQTCLFPNLTWHLLHVKRVLYHWAAASHVSGVAKIIQSKRFCSSLDRSTVYTTYICKMKCMVPNSLTGRSSGLGQLLCGSWQIWNLHLHFVTCELSFNKVTFNCTADAKTDITAHRRICLILWTHVYAHAYILVELWFPLKWWEYWFKTECLLSVSVIHGYPGYLDAY